MSEPTMNDSIQLQRSVIPGTESGQHLLITGGVHGNEFESMAALRRLIAHFEGEKARAALCGQLTLVPVVNEAAYLRGATGSRRTSRTASASWPV